VVVLCRDDFGKVERLLEELWEVMALGYEEIVQAVDEVGDEDLADSTELFAPLRA
jgi:hypothetical protein